MLRLRQLACARDLCPQEFLDGVVEGGGQLQNDIQNDIKRKSGMSQDEERSVQMILYENRNEECTICFDVSVGAAALG